MAAERITFSTDDLLSPKKAAAYLGITTMTLWRWSKDGKLPVMQVDGRTFYAKRELDSLKKKGPK